MYLSSNCCARQIQPRPSAGFSLIEIAIVLVILAILAVSLGSPIAGMVDLRHREDTGQNLQKVETALVSFVSSVRRLPCPANGALTNGDVNWGLEVRSASGVCDAMTTGVVPWRTIGLTPADAVDGWRSLITYRVALNLTVDGGMTLSDCDPAGTASAAGINQLCSATCVGTNLSTCTMPSAFLAGKGLKIQNNPDPLAVPPVVLMALADPAATPATGAAFVLISAGPTLGPAYNLNGQLVPTTAVVGTEEAKNANNQPLQTYYVDDDANNSSSTLHFDDIVRRPSVATIIGKANLGPRAH